MKKNIKCPDCNIICKEVIRAVINRKIVKEYPKPIFDKKGGKTYSEYRYFCNRCKKEWIHNTLFNYIENVPENSQFYFDVKQNLLILRSSRKK